MIESKVDTKPIGVIEALSAGYRMLNRAWAVWVIPFGLDVLFWLGPQLTPWEALRRLYEQLDPEMRRLMANNMGLEAIDWSQPPPGPNLLTLLSLGPGAPSTLASTFGFLPAPDMWDRPVVSLASAWGLVGLMLLLLVLGAPVAALYLSLAARAVAAHTSANEMPFLSRWGWTTGQLVLLMVVLVVVAGAAVVGLSLGMVVGLLLNPALGAVIVGMGTLVLTWLLLSAWVLFYFTPVSIALDRQNAWEALVRSAKLVTRNLGSSLGLILLSLLIAEGFALVWRRFFFAWPGVLLSLLGNAYLTSGLTLAAFIFYHDRWPRLAQASVPSKPASHREQEEQP